MAILPPLVWRDSLKRHIFFFFIVSSSLYYLFCMVLFCARGCREAGEGDLEGR